MSVKVCSQLGSDSTGTNVLAPNVSGNSARNRMPCTAPGVRAIMPMKTEIQHRHSANPIASTTAASTWKTSVSARKPIT